MNSTSLVNIELGKRTWVAGLTWVPLTRQRDLVGDAKAQMRKFGGDAFVIRSGTGIAQVGIGNTKEGAKRGALSLASAIADYVAGREFTVASRRQRVQDWIGLFEVQPGRWFLIAVRDGAIVPNCDRIADYSVAYDLLEQTYGISGWSAVFGSGSLPSKASYHNFIELELDEALGLTRGRPAKLGKHALRTVVSSRTPMLAVGAFAVLAALGAASWWTYQRHLDEQAAAAAALLAASGQDTPNAAPKVKVETPKGWLVVPTPEALTTQCVAHLDIPAAPGTWTLAGYSCDTQGSTVTLAKNDFTNVGYLKELIPDAQVGDEQNTATWSRPFTELLFREDELIAWTTLATDLFARMQIAGITAAVGPVEQPPPPVIPPEQADTVEVIPPSWVERTLSIGPTEQPPDVVRRLADFPGVRLHTISNKDGQWTYEGRIYVH